MIKRPVKFTFPKDLITKSIIYQLGRKFELVTNIRRADVRADMGWVVLELEGEENEIKKGLKWVTSNGVRVDPVGGDVLEG